MSSGQAATTEGACLCKRGRVYGWAGVARQLAARLRQAARELEEMAADPAVGHSRSMRLAARAIARELEGLLGTPWKALPLPPRDGLDEDGFQVLVAAARLGARAWAQELAPALAAARAAVDDLIAWGHGGGDGRTPAAVAGRLRSVAAAAARSAAMAGTGGDGPCGRS